jgi:DNA polymerase III sliding clamp (beta) subunit (PCNA family)
MMVALQADTLLFVLPDNRLLVARLVEGEFPDYRGVVPNPDATKQIASVSERASPMRSRRYRFAVTNAGAASGWRLRITSSLAA